MDQSQPSVDSLHVFAATYLLILWINSLWKVEGVPISDLKRSSLELTDEAAASICTWLHMSAADTPKELSLTLKLYIR